MAETNFSSSNAGALAITEVMRRLPQALAGDHTESAADYFAKRESAIFAILAAAGPMSPRATGALQALAEFVVGGEQDGCTYDLEQWTPEAAMSEAERSALRALVFA